MINFTIRCSAIHQIMAGNIGLTDIQDAELNELIKRNLDFCNKVVGVKPLTDIMTAKVKDFTDKKNNPELPQGAKTYCKKWLKEYLYQRWRELSNKYIEKGNSTEADGVTLTCVQLKLGMVIENKERRDNGTLNGMIDYIVDNVVYDNKSSWDLETFPMFETHPKEEHVWQMQGYCQLWDTPKAVLAYTLNDAPEKMLYDAIRWYDDYSAKANIIKNMVYTQAGWERAAALFFEPLPLSMYPKFVPIPDKDRIKTFTVMRDNIKIGAVYQRRNMCNSYINSLITNS